uniref:DUF86 domain-containing protein n=1 Tax=uncultured marine group II/III euryarchaeote KM3_153_G11 TaxID=1457896 RepID=A0A075GKE4_9EURY|nr:hypothetical protein, containing DUF86 domain [uncultured marine group II/III euryarchaeote KM3_153_G11]
MKDDIPYHLHIRECIARIQRFTEEGKRAVFADTMIQDAVIRNLQVLAESTQRIAESTKMSHPEVPWHEIAGFRNVVAHGSLGIDLKQIWLIMEQNLEELQGQVETKLRSVDSPS